LFVLTTDENYLSIIESLDTECGKLFAKVFFDFNFDEGIGGAP
jgi:hypothetical protein